MYKIAVYLLPVLESMTWPSKSNAAADYKDNFEKLIVEIGNGRYMDTYDTYSALLLFFTNYIRSAYKDANNRDENELSLGDASSLYSIMKSSINVAVNYVIVEPVIVAQLSKLPLFLSTRLKDTEIDVKMLTNAMYEAFIDLLNEYELRIKKQCSSIMGSVNTVLAIPPGRYLVNCLSTWEKNVPIMYLRHRHLKHPYKPRGKPVYFTSLPYLRGKLDTVIVESVLVASEKALVPPGSVTTIKELEPENIYIIAIPPALSQSMSITIKNLRPVIEYMMENGEIINVYNREILNITDYNIKILTGTRILSRSTKKALASEILSTSKEWNNELINRIIEKYKTEISHVHSKDHMRK